MTDDLAIRPTILSPQRFKVLAFVAQFDHVPSASEVAQHMGWQNNSSVGEVFGTLRGAGLMEKLPKLPGPRRQATRWTVTDAGRKAISQQAR